MNTLLNDPLVAGIFVGLIVFLFFFQLLILLRIRRMYQQISYYIESISKLFYRMNTPSAGSAKKQQLPTTCQFCKHRLSFIHMSDNKGEVEDFYYKCELHNIEIALEDSCGQFEKDNIYG